jgi:hypothetical protein
MLMPPFLRPLDSRLVLPLLLSLGMLGACESMKGDAPPATGSAVAPSMPTPKKTTPRPDFIVHEWGTFTSMQSSDGKTLGGMYEEDEPLPEFVHRFELDANRPTQKGLVQTPDNYRMLTYATQRLETPVLYFYGAKPPSRVQVTVNFPEGIISEWYPQADTYAPSPNTISSINQGSMTWVADLLDRPAKVIPVPEDDIWAPSRRVDALTVKVNEQEEPLIFYRGVGTFTLPITVKSEQTHTLMITNESDVDIPQTFLYKNLNGRKAIYPLGPLAARAHLDHGGIFASPSPKEGPAPNASIEDLKAPLLTALTDAGLYPKEARAMVDTWEQSYFDTPGVRLLYIVPDAWTDKLLPLTIDPKPDELVRVLIGRIEVRSATQEEDFEARMLEHFNKGTAPDLSTLGPFLMPRLQAMFARNYTSNPDFSRWLQALALEHHARVPVLETAPTPSQEQDHTR